MCHQNSSYKSNGRTEHQTNKDVSSPVKHLLDVHSKISQRCSWELKFYNWHMIWYIVTIFFPFFNEYWTQTQVEQLHDTLKEWWAKCTYLKQNGVLFWATAEFVTEKKCKKIEDKKHHVMHKLSLQRKVNFQFLILGFTYYDFCFFQLQRLSKRINTRTNINEIPHITSCFMHFWHCALVTVQSCKTLPEPVWRLRN